MALTKRFTQEDFLMYNKHLDAFLTAADCGSFTKAADKLFISPNALIKQVNLLEGELGITLFSRTNHGIALTEAGKSIYRDARRIIHISGQALATAKALTTVKRNVIRLGSSMMSPCRPIVKLWVAVSSDYPHIKIQIVQIDDEKNDKMEFLDKKTGSADIIAGIFPSTLWKNKVSALKIRQIPLSVAVPINHPLAGRKRLTLTDLYGETLLMVERGDTDYIDRLRDDLEQNHPQIHIHDVPPYDINIFNYAETTGRPMISADLWSDIHPSLVTLPCDWGNDYSVPYGILYAKEPSAHVREFVQIIKRLL